MKVIREQTDAAEEQETKIKIELKTQIWFSSNGSASYVAKSGSLDREFNIQIYCMFTTYSILLLSDIRQLLLNVLLMTMYHGTARLSFYLAAIVLPFFLLTDFSLGLLEQKRVVLKHEGTFYFDAVFLYCIFWQAL